MKNIAIIFAGGTGKRMGASIPKQFLSICGKEIIIHTLELFQYNSNIDEIYVVCIEGWIEHLKEEIKKYDINKVKQILPGGETGQDSIFIGLESVHKSEKNAIVLIHDGVRPLVDEDVIEKCIESVKKYNSAITSISAFETPIISYRNNVVSEMPNRSKVFIAKAPQCFYLNDIYNAHIEERKNNPNYNGIVDSCGLMFKHNFKCHLIEGNRDNIKVTTSENLIQLISNYNLRDYHEVIKLNNNVKKENSINNTKVVS